MKGHQAACPSYENKSKEVAGHGMRTALVGIIGIILLRHEMKIMALMRR